MDIGISPSSFWGYSIGEIYALIESYNRRMSVESDKAISDLKVKAMLNSVLARQIAEYVCAMLDKDATITSIEDLLPELFEKERKENEEIRRKTEIELHKAKMMDYAERHNSRRKKGEVK